MLIIVALIVLGPLFPILIKVTHIDLQSIDPSATLNALIFTVKQAVLSGALATVIGLLGAPGFARLVKTRPFVRWLLLLPNLVSPLLIILGLFLTFDPFPFGMTGILMAHVLINGGFAIVCFGERWESLETKWRSVAEVYGASDFYFIRRVMLPLLNPLIRSVFLTVFIFCLSSFVIPLILGGGPGYSTLEVLIYEQIRSQANLPAAVLLSLVLSFIQFIVFMIFYRSLLLKKEYPKYFQELPRRWSWLIVTAIITFCMAVPIWQLLKVGVPHFPRMKEIIMDPVFVSAMTTSIMVGLCVSFITTLGTLFLVARGWPKLLIGIPTLSGVVVGLGLILTNGPVSSEDGYKVIVFLTLGHLAVIALPVWRQILDALQSLRNQFEAPLSQMGISGITKIRKVYGPLGIKNIAQGATLAFCWSLGEFSVSSMVGQSQVTVPLYVRSLLGSYRLEQAAVCSMFLLIAGGLGLLLFEVLQVGENKKS